MRKLFKQLDREGMRAGSTGGGGAAGGGSAGGGGDPKSGASKEPHKFAQCVSLSRDEQSSAKARIKASIPEGEFILHAGMLAGADLPDGGKMLASLHSAMRQHKVSMKVRMGEHTMVTQPGTL